MIKLSSSVLALFFGYFFCISPIAVVYAQSHHDTGYVSWGTDEFELFGLTKAQLTKKFKGELEFDQNFETAWLSPKHTGPQFILSFSNGKVIAVQRMFVDGMGCHIMGPILKSQKEAARFSIEGLTENPKPNLKDQAKLALAKKELADGMPKDKQKD
ncbi:MAG: hypothetical protein EKK48_15095 [Candidatus Melainabacteria bacterium]|nr:MAG: hypothetical protein EKK48_15095 [Candidatus Melainabacteria bacterium]